MAFRIGRPKKLRWVKNNPTLQALGLIFITLKLLGHVPWPWWQVLAPLFADSVLRALAGWALERKQREAFPGDFAEPGTPKPAPKVDIIIVPTDPTSLK